MKIGTLYMTYKDRGDFFIHLILEHLYLSLISIFFATIIGIFLGILISEYKKIANIVIAITNVLYTIPTIALLGILITFTGIGNTSAIIALTVYGLLPIVRNTYAGITNIDASIIEAAEGMGTNKIQMYYKVKLPLAFPVIFSAFRGMAVMTISLCTVASFIGAGGIGVAIYRGITTNNNYLTIAGSILVILLALLVDKYFSIVEKSIIIKNYKILKYTTGIVILIFLISVYFIRDTSNEKIVIATKPQTDQFILGEMLKILIEDNTDLEVKLVKGIGGGTTNIHPALLNGEFDMYSEYTGTAWNIVLKREDELYTQELFEEYNEKFGLTWGSIYGYNSTYTLTVKESFAEEHNLKTFSDLARISDTLVLGAEYDFFEREDGFSGLVEAYGFNFKNTVDLDIGLKFDAIETGKVDVINAFSTDGMLRKYNLRVLEDDRNYFLDYSAGLVIRNDIIEKYPEVMDVLQLLEGIISDEDMSLLNFYVESENIDEREVAIKFLKEAGVLWE